MWLAEAGTRCSREQQSCCTWGMMAERLAVCVSYLDSEGSEGCRGKCLAIRKRGRFGESQGWVVGVCFSLMLLSLFQ